MKKYLIVIIIAFALSGSANAQFTNIGFRVGAGLSTLTDDLTEKTPISSISGGIYTTYEFNKVHSLISEVFYVQLGVNFVRRGGKYEEVFNLGSNLSSQHTGSIDAWYVQVPLLANLRLELPLKKRKHYARAFFGPAVSIGVLGKYNEQKVTPYQDSRKINFKIAGEGAFDYLNRIDAELIAGLGYEHKNITISIYVDHGFLSVMDEPDILRTLESGNPDEPVMHAGSSLSAYMISFSYRIPIGSNTDPRAVK
ncbi:MAG: PorT family protein [Bacteroidales bacterium]|nr:PorT family protein [Bacteroidales bacterium]